MKPFEDVSSVPWIDLSLQFPCTSFMPNNQYLASICAWFLFAEKGGSQNGIPVCSVIPSTLAFPSCVVQSTIHQSYQPLSLNLSYRSNSWTMLVSVRLSVITLPHSYSACTRFKLRKFEIWSSCQNGVHIVAHTHLEMRGVLSWYITSTSSAGAQKAPALLVLQVMSPS